MWAAAVLPRRLLTNDPNRPPALYEFYVDSFWMQSAGMWEEPIRPPLRGRAQGRRRDRGRRLRGHGDRVPPRAALPRQADRAARGRALRLRRERAQRRLRGSGHARASTSCTTHRDPRARARTTTRHCSASARSARSSASTASTATSSRTAASNSPPSRRTSTRSGSRSAASTRWGSRPRSSTARRCARPCIPSASSERCGFRAPRS